MMKPFLFSLMLASSLLMSSRAGGLEVLPTKVLRLDGFITSNAVRRLIDTYALKPFTKIVVKSEGGEELAAMELADFISSKKIELFVDSYCLSACANAILPSANGRIESNGAIIGYHYSSYFIYESLVSINEIPNDDIVSMKNHLESIYLDNGIDIKLLSIAGKSANIVVLKYGDVGSGAPYKWYAQYEMWIPSRRTLAANGYRIRYTKPESKEELISRYLGAYDRERILVEE